MRREPLVALTLAFAALGCGGSAPGPSGEDPLAYLRVGTDPRTEAESSTLALARAGYLVEQRLEGRAFVAIAGTRRRDRRSAVRIFTSRGAALALDAPDPRFPDRRSVALLPARAPFDLDGAEGEELAIEVVLASRRCLALVRVTEDGAAAEVPLPLTELPGAPCVERLADVAGDSRLELLTTLRFDGAGLEPAPSVPFALGAERGAFRPLPPALGRAFYAPERRAREEAAERASGTARLGLAVEAAALSRLEGRAGDDAVAAFDRLAAAAEGVDDAKRVARAFVVRGLGLPSSLAPDAVLDGPP